MSQTPEKPTLQKARQVALKKVARVSDFITKEQKEQLALARAKGQKKHIHFDNVDAISAEIVSRFGYDVYKAWNTEEISNKKMMAWIMAERTREKATRLEMLNIIVSAVAGANNAGKNGQAPKSLKAATKNLKRLATEIKEASK